MNKKIFNYNSNFLKKIGYVGFFTGIIFLSNNSHGMSQSDESRNRETLRVTIAEDGYCTYINYHENNDQEEDEKNSRELVRASSMQQETSSEISHPTIFQRIFSQMARIIKCIRRN